MSEDVALPTPPEEERSGPPVVAPIKRKIDSMLETKRGSNMLIIVGLLFAAIPIIGIGLATTRTILPYDRVRSMLPLPLGTSDGISAMFTCEHGKTIGALFSNASVELSLSDGRHLTLPQARSASGARYANPDESFVFWNKGTTAFIQEAGTTTYSGCVTKS